MRIERVATIAATITALFLAVIKVVVGIITGSVAVIASSLDSLLDMVISIFNTIALKVSEQKPTEKFNYGLGKVEGLAALFEGGLIIASGGFIIFEGIRKLVTHSQIERLELSIGVMVLSMVATGGLVAFMSYVAKKSNNLIIRSDLLHYKTDLLTNGAVLVSLILVKLTGLYQIDFILSILIGGYIIKEAVKIVKEGLEVLLDISLPADEVKKIEEIIRAHPKVEDFHCLKTRKSGPRNFVEVHLVFNPKMTIEEAHDVVEEVEEQIRKLDPRVKWIISTHIDPYDDYHLNKLLHEC